jgi:proteic killer suppression protein
VTDLVAGRPHPLVGDRVGQFAVDLDGACRLVFQPTLEPHPVAPSGGIAWQLVVSITIIYIGNYHD